MFYEACNARSWAAGNNVSYCPAATTTATLYHSPTFPQPQQMPPDQKAPPPQALSSSQVEQQIQKHLSTEPDLANTDVQVKADDRLVILTGTVDSDAQHDLALRIAESYAGERKLVDKIKVRQQT